MGIFDLLRDHVALLYLSVGFVSLAVGSFLNVVIHRLPIMMERAWREGLDELDASEPATDPIVTASPVGGDSSALSVHTGGSSAHASVTSETFNLAVPRSRCPHCGHEITAIENIPVLSYLALRGKCSSCHEPISARYPFVEFVTMLLSLMIAWRFGATPEMVLALVVTWFFIAMSLIDFDTQLLPDSLTLPLMWVGLIASLFPIFADVRSAVIGAAAGYLILWSIYWLFKLITGKEGMGYGDFKLLAAIGALLGWQALPMVILLSSLVGAVVGVGLILVAGRDKNIPIPFGPYLAAAGWIAMLGGDALTSYYFNLLG